MSMTRRAAIFLPFALPLGLAACGDDSPRVYAPLRYDYLTPLRLNVATLDFAPLPPPGPLDQTSPVPLGPAVQQMTQDRLSASGSSGRAVLTIETARIEKDGDGLSGEVALHLDVFATDGRRGGFAEARVVRRVSRAGSSLRSALYDMTKQMLDDLNIEMEFQLRRSLRDYLQTTTTAPTPAAVQQQDLAAPKP